MRRIGGNFLGTFEYLIDWSKRRIHAGISHKAIRPSSLKTLPGKHDPLIKGSGEQYLREYRYAPIPADMPVRIYLYDEKVVFLSGRIGNVYAAVLESKDVYETLSSIFEILWNVAEPVE